jgi:hypothetical protein
MINEFVDGQLIEDLARNLIEDLAPQELPIYRATSKAFLENPDHVTKRQWTREEKLGFGLPEATVFLTPVVLAVTTAVVKFFVETVKEAIKNQTVEEITALVRKLILRRPSSAEKDAYALSREELGKVRELVLRTALDLKVSEPQAEILANAIVGRLAVAD